MSVSLSDALIASTASSGVEGNDAIFAGAAGDERAGAGALDYFGAIRMAPSSRITSPFSIGFSMI